MEFITKFFKLQENKTTVRTEIVAGITTFMTMAYILFLNPNILSATGMDKNAVFFATAIAAGFVTIAMGLVANFPIALAPGMGLNAFFATVALAGVGMPWRIALGAVFISGIIFILLTVTKVRQILVVAVPRSLKVAITVGIGLFITIIGLKLSEIMVASANVIPPTLDAMVASKGQANLMFFEWNIGFGSLKNMSMLLCLLAAMEQHRVPLIDRALQGLGYKLVYQSPCSRFRSVSGMGASPRLGLLAGVYQHA